MLSGVVGHGVMEQAFDVASNELRHGLVIGCEFAAGPL